MTTTAQPTTAQPTTAQPTTTQSKKSHVSVVARSVISTVSVLVLLGTVILGFIWYLRRYNTTGGSSPFSRGVIEAAAGVEVTPFVSSRPDMTPGNPMARTGLQQPWLPATVVRGADIHDQYFSPFFIHLQSPTSVLVGLSDKELARIRAENLPSRRAIDATAVTLPGDASRSQFQSLPATTIEQREMPTSVPLFRTFQSQVDRIWREIRQLRAERLGGSEAPPSYAENDVSHHGGGVQP